MSLPTRVAQIALPALIATPGVLFAQNVESSWDFYGHLNLGIISVDDGFDTETGLTDNDNSNSRAGVMFKQGLQNGAEFRFNFETGLGLTGSSSISLDDNSFDVDYSRTELRKVEIVYASPTLGTFWFGQGSTASDGAAESDLSGTSLIAYSSPQDLSGSQEFRLASGAGSGVRGGDVFNSFDGARRFRIRYDTPKYNGFVASISAGTEVLASGNDDEYYDIGVTYGRDYGDFNVAGGLAYSIRDSAEELLVGSAAVLHTPTGVSFALSGGSEQQGDASYFYAKAGLQRDWFAIGRTALSLDYYGGDDFEITGSSSSSIGLAVVQKLDAYNVELYATYRTYEFESAGSDYEDLDVTFVGARWKF
ncbi:porin [Sulfitobacter sp. SK012]|uniref:porin n=1 Tax=Sulfitobacter sp. SK012 TaxID=1389005 RepID=UPI000E0AF290|nr:porin [Sulfitobacter sp. SK012]AXI48050.1 porin [Sulfitobacter sp. SK012]